MASSGKSEHKHAGVHVRQRDRSDVRERFTPPYARHIGGVVLGYVFEKSGAMRWDIISSNFCKCGCSVKGQH